MGQKKDSIYGNNKRNLRCNFIERQAAFSRLLQGLVQMIGSVFKLARQEALGDGMITAGLSLILTVTSQILGAKSNCGKATLWEHISYRADEKALIEQHYRSKKLKHKDRTYAATKLG